MSTTNHDDTTDTALRSNALLGAGSDDVRRETKNGREYLVTPVVAAREMVLNYPEINGGQKEFLPSESFQSTADLWAGEPVTTQHPTASTAKSPDAYTEHVFGQVHEPDADADKLRFNEVWVDVERANELGGDAAEVVDRLEAGDPVAVSPGYQPLEIDPSPGRYNGEQYDAVQGEVIPDHLAMFPPDAHQARCDLEDGCGAPRANAVADDALRGDVHDTTAMTNDENDPLDPSTVQRVMSAFGWTGGNGQRANADGTPEGGHDGDCGCGGECGECGDGEQGGSETEPDGGDASGAGGADDSTHMDDETIEDLAEQTVFSEESLRDMNEDELDAVEQITVDDDGGETADEGGDAGTATADGGEAGADADAGTETAEARANAGDADVDMDELASMVRQNAEAVGDVADSVDELRENFVEDEYADEIRTVTNAVDDMTEDDARDLADTNPSALETLAEQHRQSERTNYAARPGQIDRTPDEGASVDDYPAGGRSDYEQRQNAGGD